MTPKKPLPSNISAEKGILGSGLIKSDVLYDIVEFLKPDDFYLDKHKLIYKEMLELLDNEGAFDLVTFIEHLKKKKLIDENINEIYLVELIDAVSSVKNIIYYANVVKEKAKLRKLCNIFNTAFNMALDEGKPEDIVTSVEVGMFSIFQDSNSVNKIGIFYDELFEKMKEHELVENEDIKTGYKSLDHVITLSPSDYIVVAGRPGMGKTQFFLNMILNITKDNIPILFFSLEMSKYQIFERLIKIISGESINSYNFLDIEKKTSFLKDLPLYIDDTPRMSISDIKLIARRMKIQNDIKVIFIDHMQLITYYGKDRYHQMTEISGMIKGLAKELNIPIIVASQLSRGVEQRINKRPLLSDLRESGAIEQDADVVIFLYREDYYKQNTISITSPLEGIVAKNRNGRIKTISFLFNKETGRILDV